MDVEFCNTSGATALHYFFGRKHGDDLKTSMDFLKKVVKLYPNVNWNAANNGGATYLAFAVQVEHRPIAISLIRNTEYAIFLFEILILWVVSECQFPSYLCFFSSLIYMSFTFFSSLIYMSFT